jgi:hypothetical protein
MATITDQGVCPAIAAMDTARSSDGTDSMRSTRRIAERSTQPPNQPATRPSRTPPARPSRVDSTPTSSEARAPQMSLLSTSPP